MSAVMSYIGWDLQQRAQWSTLELVDKDETFAMHARNVYLNPLFSTCPMDIPLRRCSVFLDGEPRVPDGKIIPADQRLN